MSARTRIPIIERCWPALIGLCMLAAPGCHRPAAPEGPTRETVPSTALEPLWDAALTVLPKHGFRPDRQDRAAGVIASLPTTSQHFWELWRQDVAEPYGFAHASLHTTQRKATVRFIRDAQSGGWSIDVQIDVYRLTTPEHQITTASSAIQGFSTALPTAEGTMVRDATALHDWVHLGRDGEMEWRLLQRILVRSGLDLMPAEISDTPELEAGG